MKKLNFIIMLIITTTTGPAMAALGLMCRCSDGTSVPQGSYCPGSMTPCGSVDECLLCDSTDWGAYKTGYESKIDATCKLGKCTKLTYYRCAAGYYGSSTNGTSGCTRCPTEDNATGSSEPGATQSTDCYMPAGTTFSNATGSGQWTGNSYYCN